QLTQVLLSEEFLKGQVNALAMMAGKNGPSTLSGVLSRISEPTQPKRRWLTAIQIEKLKSVLLSAPPGIVKSFDYCGGDQEAKDFHDQIMDQFTVSHWTVGRWSGLTGIDFYGIRVYLHYVDRVPEEFAVMKKALTAAGIAPEYEEQQIKGPASNLIAVEVCHNPA
ncbi:MAG: hypothetical protein ABSG65_13470, partial [Bryobacteraceae bacterium]